MFSSRDNLIIAISGTVTGTLGILGALSIVIMFIHQRIRNQTQFYHKLMLYLSISDLFLHLSYTPNQVYYLVYHIFEFPKQELCTASAFVHQWAVVSNDFWVAIISVYLYFRLVLKKEIDNWEVLYHVVCWVIPFFIAMFPLFKIGGSYGLAGFWCSIEGSDARLYFTYSFVWATFIVLIFCYILIFKHLKYLQEHYEQMDTIGSTGRSYNRLFRKMAPYPIVYLIQWLPAFANRLQNVLQPTNPIIELYLAQIVTVNLAGFMHAIAYAALIYRSSFNTYTLLGPDTSSKWHMAVNN